jgi:hypothetical protein
MKTNSLEQFVKLHRELTQEREQISQRISEINEALGALPPSNLSEQHSSEPAQVRKESKRGRKPAGGGLSLRAHVLDVLKDGAALTKEEVLAAVKQRGYKFSTNNPLNSLGVILYGKNPKFNRVDGKFSVTGGSNIGNGKTPSGENRGGKRQMSPAARARIAAAQKARWAAIRGEGKSGSNKNK